MAAKPVHIAMSFAMAGDTVGTGIEDTVFGALDRHGLTPQTVTNMGHPVAVTDARDFTDLWCVTGETRSIGNTPRTLTFGADWSRKNAPQGWGSVTHRLVTVQGRVKLGRLVLDHMFSPRVDWAAAFGDLCRALDPITATLDPFRRDTRSTLGFVDAFPLPARPKRERVTKPIQVDATPWGILRDVPWGLWLGRLWTDARRHDLSTQMMADGCYFRLTETLPRDPDTLAPRKSALRTALPHIFDTDPKFTGLP